MLARQAGVLKFSTQYTTVLQLGIRSVHKSSVVGAIDNWCAAHMSLTWVFSGVMWPHSHWNLNVCGWPPTLRILEPWQSFARESFHFVYVVKGEFLLTASTFPSNLITCTWLPLLFSRFVFSKELYAHDGYVVKNGKQEPVLPTGCHCDTVSITDCCCWVRTSISSHSCFTCRIKEYLWILLTVLPFLC